ncbi:MAG: hypothetical protein ACO1SV_25985 [Fimbriimonas sp.]
MPRGQRHAGTTLIEVLVVIVIFLVGILAIVQIFPKGFQILVMSRNASVATALSRDEIERMKSRPEQLPDAIVALYPDGTIDTGRSPFDLGPAADEVLPSGLARLAGDDRGEWTRFAGANATRHVIGEGRRVPAPRQVGQLGNVNFYGGLLVLQFNPVDTVTGTGIRAYGNDLTVRQGDWTTGDNRGEYDAYLLNPSGTASLKVPTGDTIHGYRVSFSAYVQAGTGYVRRDFPGLIFDAAVGTQDVNGLFSLHEQSFAALLQAPQNNIGGRYNGLVLGAIDPSSVRVQRLYDAIPNNQAWSDTDVFQYRPLVPQLGVLLFHPRAYAAFVPRNDGKEPLQARVDYDVYDWRVLREEFRFPFGLPAQHRLAVGSLKVGGQSGPDSRVQIGIENLEGPNAEAALRNTGHNRADHFVLMDLDTGGIVLEMPNGDTSASANPIVVIDKTTGLISVRDVDNNAANGITVHLRLPDGTVMTDVQIDNRALRALYMVRNEYAVQVLKAPSLYSVAFARPTFGQYYVGGTGPLGGALTRVYFPPSDAGRKVTFGEINYRTGDNLPRQLSAQDFVIQPGLTTDGIGLPYIDIRTADGDAVRLDVAIDGRSTGYAVRSVKASSVAVRTVWNPETFRLTDNTTANVQTGIDRWTRGYRKSTNETFLEQGGLLR